MFGGGSMTIEAKGSQVLILRWKNQNNANGLWWSVLRLYTFKEYKLHICIVSSLLEPNCNLTHQATLHEPWHQPVIKLDRWPQVSVVRTAEIIHLMHLSSDIRLVWLQKMRWGLSYLLFFTAYLGLIKKIGPEFWSTAFYLYWKKKKITEDKNRI